LTPATVLSAFVPPELDEAVVTSDFPLFNVVESRLVPAYLGWMCRTAAFVQECKRASEGHNKSRAIAGGQISRARNPLPPGGAAASGGAD